MFTPILLTIRTRPYFILIVGERGSFKQMCIFHRRPGPGRISIVRRSLVSASLPLLVIASSYDLGRAQDATPKTGVGSNAAKLPQVIVTAPRKKKTAQHVNRGGRAQASIPRSSPVRSTTRSANVAQTNASAGSTPQETAHGPVSGFVAHQSATGTKTDTPIIQTPQSISVVPADQLQTQQAWTAKEALRYTAGAAADTRSNFGAYDIIYNRGFPVSRYLDGMRLQGDTGFVTPQIELWGMERVELLRGPASVLYGQGTPGGIVNMVSKRPTDQPFGEIALQGGSFDRFQGAFDVGGPVDQQGQLEYRLTGLFRDSNNQVDFVKTQRQYIAPSLTWRPDADTSLTVLLSYQRDPWGGYYNFVPPLGSLYPNPNGKIPTSFYAGDPSFNQTDRTQYSAGYLFEHRVDDVWTIRQNLRYLDTTGHLNQVPPFPGGLEPDNVTLDRYAQADAERIGAFTIDNQIQAKFATGWLQHTALVGVDYQNTLFAQYVAQGAAPSINIFDPVYYQPITVPTDNPNTLVTNSHQQSSQTGVYGQDQMKIGNLILVAGGRHDWADSDTQTYSDTFGFPANTDTPQHDQANTGRIGGVYLFDNGVAPYAVYATSFNPNIGTEFSGTPFKPTTGKLYEAGVRYQPPGFETMMLTASGYDLTEQNVLTPDPANLGFNVQTGEIRSRGFEFEGKASINKQLNLIATYTYIDAKVTQSNDVDLGKVPLGIPRNMTSAWADYTFRNGALNGFGGGLGVRYVGYTWGDEANTVRVPAYVLVDAMVHYNLAYLAPQLRGYELQVNATNLFDKVYVSECTGTSGISSTNCVYGLRRSVLGTLRYRW